MERLSNQTKGDEPMATFVELLSFAKESRTKLYLVVGSLCSMLAGMCFPAMAWIFSNSFSDLAVSPDDDRFKQQIRNLCFRFLILGFLMFVFMSLHSILFERASNTMTKNLKTIWFKSLLRQDIAFFDILDISGTATIIGTNGLKFQMGVGNKLGEGIQFSFTFIGGIVFALWSSWRVTLVMLFAALPLMALSTFFLLKMNRTRTARANDSYSKAGSIVYTAVTSIRTILSLNVVEDVLSKFMAATQEAYKGASSQVILVGAANGTVIGSFLLAYLPLTLYGGYIVYENVRNTGCDPSGAVSTNVVCQPSASGVFGALMGVTFGGAALPQVMGAMEAITAARAAIFPALLVMSRKSKNDENQEENAASERNNQALQRRSSVILPEYIIDASSLKGLKPDTMLGRIEFKNVSFSYPTRKEMLITEQLSLDIKAGTTVALVGPSGGGKSTLVQLIQRFYDPNSGSIEVDGINLKEINVRWLRQQIGVVSQEPKLFAMTIADNIRIAYPEATQEAIEDAAMRANAHGFIKSFPDGYETQVGHEGSQLSGGQKQRIAIARALLSHPRILILDEATSALDSESEAQVQEALDSIMEEKRQTVIVIAHRLSTIRNADKIAVVKDGSIFEQGNHFSLIEKGEEYYRLVQAQNAPRNDSKPSIPSDPIPSTSSKQLNEGIAPSKTGQIDQERCHIGFHNVHFHYPSRPGFEVFSGLNLYIREGETLALVGPSGEGKSTIIQLLENFYRPTIGKITYHGEDMREMNVDFLRRQFGLVSQEPLLFHMSIAENIKFGVPDATLKDIEEVAKMANAHNFIMSFPEKYETIVGSTASTQVSGGEKQRIAIARALLRRPKVLILDEATSALDNKSERQVQKALDDIMLDRSQTTIVVAHRLSTIKNVDRIAVIDKGRVCEIGTHDTLMQSKDGIYRRLLSLQSLEDENVSLDDSLQSNLEETIENTKRAELTPIDDETVIVGDNVRQNIQKARLLAQGDMGYFVVGVIGAILAGLMFPGWGLIFALMIELLYKPVLPCTEEEEVCEEYWGNIADDMRSTSVKVGCGVLGVISFAVIGNILVFYGFGTASERMNKRVRDAVFKSILRQEVSWFDTQSVASMTKIVSDDASLIHTFSGEPLRVLVMNLSSLFVGIVVSFIYMWPFALLALVTLPFMAFSAKMRMRMFLGEDEGVYKEESLESSGGIIIQTISNIQTVVSLTIEERRVQSYEAALSREDPNSLAMNFSRMSIGLGQLVRVWALALYFWWGAWILQKYQESFSVRNFLVSMFSLLFSITGMAIAMQGSSDPEAAKAAADRIFDLIERQSAIDPLSKDGRRTIRQNSA